MVKRILPCDSSILTSPSLSSINRCTSSTALRGKIGKIVFGQGLQREARPAGADRQYRAVAVAFQQDLGTVGQFADDVVKHMRRHSGGTGGCGFRRQRFRHLEIKVGGL